MLTTLTLEPKYATLVKHAYNSQLIAERIVQLFDSSRSAPNLANVTKLEVLPTLPLIFTKFFQEHILKPDTQAWQKPRKVTTGQNNTFLTATDKQERELSNTPDL